MWVRVQISSDFSICFIFFLPGMIALFYLDIYLLILLLVVVLLLILLLSAYVRIQSINPLFPPIRLKKSLEDLVEKYFGMKHPT